MKLTKTAFAFVVLTLLASCVDRKSINYLHDSSLSNTSKLFPNPKFEYRVQVNDVFGMAWRGHESYPVLDFDDPPGTGFVGLIHKPISTHGSP